MANFPVKLFHPDSSDKNKRLSARNQDELEGLLKIGWKAVPEPKTIEGGPVRLTEGEK